MNDFADQHYQRALHLSDIGRWKEAIVEATKCLANEPQHYRALCTISRCHFELGDEKQALEFAGKAIKVDPTQEWAYRLQSIIYNQENKRRKGLKSALEAVKQDPESVLALQALAMSQLMQQDCKDAINTAEKIRTLEPDSADTYKTLGYVNSYNGNLIEAENYFQNALKIEPSDYEALNCLGEVLLEKYKKNLNSNVKQQIINEAIDCFRRAVAINPTSSTAKDNLRKASGLNSILGGILVIFPLLWTTIGGIALVLNTNGYKWLRPESLNINDRPFEIFFLYFASWIAMCIASWALVSVKAMSNLTETNQKTVEIIEKPNLKLKLLYGFWLIIFCYPPIFIIWKLLAGDFQAFYSLKILDWIMLLIGIIAMALNYFFLVPSLFGKNSKIL
jgi:tetratricopeptide (TPR) repeat protein